MCLMWWEFNQGGFFHRAKQFPPSRCLMYKISKQIYCLEFFAVLCVFSAKWWLEWPGKADFNGLLIAFVWCIHSAMPSRSCALHFDLCKSWKSEGYVLTFTMDLFKFTHFLRLGRWCLGLKSSSAALKTFFIHWHLWHGHVWERHSTWDLQKHNGWCFRGSSSDQFLTSQPNCKLP